MYSIYGYKGKQVRDNIHAYDLAQFIRLFLEKPRIAEVYNIGGGKNNSISILSLISYPNFNKPLLAKKASFSKGVTAPLSFAADIPSDFEIL